MQTVYVLRSEKDGNLYVGCTNNLERRFLEHTQGLVTSTKHRRPLQLIFTETFTTKEEAFAIEHFYKTAKGKRQLRAKMAR